VKYPAFRPSGQEIQVGDLVRRQVKGAPLGIVVRLLDHECVAVLWTQIPHWGEASLIARTHKQFLEVIDEGG